MQMGVVGGGGGWGAPWLPIGGAGRVLATHQSPSTNTPKPPAPTSCSDQNTKRHVHLNGQLLYDIGRERGGKSIIQ